MAGGRWTIVAVIGCAITAVTLVGTSGVANACSVSGENPLDIAPIVFVGTVREIGPATADNQFGTETRRVTFDVEAVARGKVTQTEDASAQYGNCTASPTLETGRRYLVAGGSRDDRVSVYSSSELSDSPLPNQFEWSAPRANPWLPAPWGRLVPIVLVLAVVAIVGVVGSLQIDRPRSRR